MRSDENSEDSDIEKMNHESFNSMMNDLNKASRDWVLAYVERLKIPMRSRQWLPAALAARMILEMAATARTLAEENKASIVSMTKAIEQVNLRIAAVDRRLENDEASRSHAAKFITGVIGSAVEDAVARIRDPIDGAAEKIRAIIVNVATTSATAATESVVRNAARWLDETLAAFVRRTAVGLAGALVLGLALGVTSTHWFESAHPRASHVSVAQKTTQHPGKTRHNGK